MSDASGEEESAKLFSDVLANIRLDCLPDFAFAVRREKSQSDRRSWAGPVTVDSQPIFGSYHVIFPLKFSDGLKWLLKVPAEGTKDRFDNPAARALTSEALTMQFLRSKTTIPIPEVFAFDPTFENELNCPFILMQFISGISLYDCWFDKKSPKETVRKCRTRALEGIAAAMMELDEFSFERGGSILFDKQGYPESIGPIRHVDNPAMLDRLKIDDADDTAIYVDLGPFQDAKSFYLSVLDRQPEPSTLSGQGELKLLRLFLQWMPQAICNGKEFVLAHPDFDIQNVIVSEDGTLQGLIDWDGVAAVPQGIGNKKYPGWLTRDWDPAMYAYKEEMENDTEPAGVWEDSPEDLAFYRSTYDKIMYSCVSHRAQHEARTQGAIDTMESDLRCSLTLTRNSLIVENLYIAADNPLCTSAILEKIFDEIALAVGKGQYRPDISSESKVEGGTERVEVHAQVSNAASEQGEKGNPHSEDGVDDWYEPDDFYIYDVTCALADGVLDKRRIDYLKEGFAMLLSR